ncbi:trihelix transcription factor ASIL2 [Cucurbita moschata]|uniref:Trihelix transcription factor ASIL2 n=1 Tax=Cucurbita moschata TaxID=3662 RepID=A0A6J1GZB5_CUCMO|nr:trihelix transcription factor ASIL2 [Cucurbita moschata]
MEIKPTPSSPLNSETTSPSLLFNHHHHHLPSAIDAAAETPSPKKPPASTTGAGDRLKRDEWSEGAVSTLLEAYESKWVLRNRAKLKGHDWEDVARHVSSRADFTKSPKTQTQCKNKIESMKKRYRSESASAASSWPLYHRLHLLLRGNTLTPPPPPPTPVILLDPPPPPPAPPPFLPAQNSHGSNGGDRINPKEDGVDNGRRDESDELSEKSKKMVIETDSSTPAIVYSDKDKVSMRPKQQTKMKNTKKKNKSTRLSAEDSLEQIAGSIRWLAEVVVRSEQARMEMIKDIEKMRAEAEAKRGEMDLKRTQIIANTQLEIAKLFASATNPIDSSPRIGRT